MSKIRKQQSRAQDIDWLKQTRLEFTKRMAEARRKLGMPQQEHETTMSEELQELAQEREGVDGRAPTEDYDLPVEDTPNTPNLQATQSEPESIEEALDRASLGNEAETTQSPTTDPPSFPQKQLTMAELRLLPVQSPLPRTHYVEKPGVPSE